jgi:hypothetical protein
VKGIAEEIFGIKLSIFSPYFAGGFFHLTFYMLTEDGQYFSFNSFIANNTRC